MPGPHAYRPSPEIPYEKITAEDLAQAWRVTDDDGLYYQLCPDGPVKKVALYRRTQQIEWLLLESGRVEDGANVEEYSGRYERESRWSGGFRQ